MTRREVAPGWTLIFALAVLGLVRPLLSILGAYGSLEKPWGPILVTIFIAAIWVCVVAGGRFPKPVLTPALAGGLYGVLAIVLQQTMWHLFLDGPPQGAPASPPMLVTSWIAILETNTIWGAPGAPGGGDAPPVATALDGPRARPRKDGMISG